MDFQAIRTALSTIQMDPDSESAWEVLNGISEDAVDGQIAEVLEPLRGAVQEHRERKDWDVVARLLELSGKLAAGSQEESNTLFELATVLSDELLEQTRAMSCLQKARELAPGDGAITAALAENEQRKAQASELSGSYLAEAEQASDKAYRSSMFMRAAEIALRYGDGDPVIATIQGWLERALEVEPGNERVGIILVRLYWRAEAWKDAARVLEVLALRSAHPGTRRNQSLKLAKLYEQRLENPDGALRIYEAISADVPEHPVALRFLTDYYADHEQWDELVRLLERKLHKPKLGPEHLAEILQIATLHWYKRESFKDAFVWFERLRGLEPAHSGLLEFYRAYCKEYHEEGILLEVLRNALGATEDENLVGELTREISGLVANQKQAKHEIIRLKSKLRQDRSDAQTRDELKQLYTQTQSYTALIELLRQQLSQVPSDSLAEREAILQEVANVYRQHGKGDSALVSVLTQIVQIGQRLDQTRPNEIRELVSLYEGLERWRDLITHETRLAEISEDRAEQVRLYRSVAKRWLDQFSNAQNAAEAYARLLQLDPADRDVRAKLAELYRKRRAWDALYALLEGELDHTEGQARGEVMREMARLAAESLGRRQDAYRLYRTILKETPDALDALDTMDRLAERYRDWSVLAESLEHRAEITKDVQVKVSILQKLGSIYAELEDGVRVNQTWVRVLDLQPGHRRALRSLRDAYLRVDDYDGLEQFYAYQKDWEGLAEVLGSAADKEADTAKKLDLSYRAAAVYEKRLGQPDRAFRAYERVLSVAPDEVRATKALMPLYERDENWAKLPALYETVLKQAGTEVEELDVLQKLVRVSADRLSDPASAVQYARRAYELAPRSEAGLQLFENTSRLLGDWGIFIETLDGRIKDAVDGSTGGPGQLRRGVEGASDAFHALQRPQ